MKTRWSRSEHSRLGFASFWMLAGILIVSLWAVVALWVVPGLIRSAHAQESLPFLNRIISRPDIYDVDYYLEKWSGIALRISVVVGLLVTSVAVLRSGLLRLLEGHHYWDRPVLGRARRS